MRKLRPIDALFSKTQQGVLSATCGQPDRWWYMSELAAHLATTPSSLQRELRALVTSGILRRRRDGKRVYYQAETSLPFFPELRGIMEKACGVVEALRQALGRFGHRIRVAFIHGSVAEAREHALSDVDLVVIGSVGLADLAPTLRRIEKQMRRELNAVTYTLAEWRAKAAARDHFVAAVVKNPKTFLKGTADELEKHARK
jgi:predicted nucleotidyltransferase